jgi:predicted P-loop ATPase
MNYTDILLPTKIVEKPKAGGCEVNDIDLYFIEAQKLLFDSGADSKLRSEAMTEISRCMVLFEDKLKVELYIEDLAKEFKIKKSAFNIALKYAKKLLKEENDGEIGDDNTPLINRVENYIKSRYMIFFNLIANKFMYKRIEDVEYREMNIDNIYRELKKHHLSYSHSDLKSLLKSDFTSKINVFEEYFENLPEWDGIDHIGKLAEYVKVQELTKNSNERERFNRMFKKMFVRMVACSLEAGFNKQCFTLVHDKQNSGKSTFLRWLCPPKLANYYTEAVGISKDDLIALTENFINNIDELSTLSKVDLNALKSVMSKDRVKVRLPYGERPEMLQRRCNFVASTNRLEFLSDETGSVRWVCFLLSSIDWDYKKNIDIDKVWSQANHLFNTIDYNYQLTPEEIIENEIANKTFLIRTVELELIQKYLDPSTKEEFEENEYDETVKFMTATDVVTFIQHKNAGSIKLIATNVGKALTILGFTQKSKYSSNNEYSIKGYYVKEK